jgi:hypothetical protein
MGFGLSWGKRKESRETRDGREKRDNRKVVKIGVSFAAFVAYTTNVVKSRNSESAWSGRATVVRRTKEEGTK